MWAAIATIGGFALAIIATLAAWNRKQISNAVDAGVLKVLKEVKPNGGQSESLGDTASRTEVKVALLATTVAETNDSVVKLTAAQEKMTEWASHHDGYHQGWQAALAQRTER